MNRFSHCAVCSKRKSVCRAEAEDSNIDERRGRARRLEHTESEDSADATEEDSEETSTTYTNQSGSAAERGRSSIASRRSQKSSCHSGTPKPTQVPERLRNAIRQSTRSSPRFGQSTKKVKQENPSESEYAESGSDVEKSKRSVSLRQLSKLKGASSCHRADLSMRKRRKRFAAALAEEALDRSAEANDSNSDDDAEENGDDGDEFEVEKTVDQASGRRYATSRSSSPESAGNLRGRKTVKRMKRGRRRNSDNSVEYSSKERSKDGDSLQNDSLEPGRVVCVYDDSVRKGKWIPAVVVASEAYRNNHKAARPLARSEIAVRRFKDAK
ncbi:hypothetical protein AB6A40_010006 [Gnathostoma spinigerum]|uniref:PWWP domain-containing protein n=1 Tax=Gnathostoma spinigerum TaxID=75299 RepID=A0ABD6F1N6_9BILA